MSDTTPAPDTTTTDAATPPTPNIKFGFGVLVDENGSVYLEKDPKLFSLPVEREASLIEIRRYCSEILMDLEAQAAGEYASMKIAAQLKAESN